MTRYFPSMAGVRFGLLLGLLATTPWGCSEGDGRTFYLNLFTSVVDSPDPFDGVSRLEAVLGDGTSQWQLEQFEHQADFGPLNGSSECRIEVMGTNPGGERLAWGFSPLLRLDSEVVKTSMFFTDQGTAVAHAGPLLIDAGEGLDPIGVPVSLHLDTITVTVAYNSHHLYFEIDVEDDVVVANDDDIWAGDLVALSLDQNGDSVEEERGFDDATVVFGESQFIGIWPAQSSILHDFKVTEYGYRVFASIPLLPPVDNATPGPSRVMKLGLEIQDDDGVSQPTTTRWPADWNPHPSGEHQYFAFGSGRLALKTRLLDARKVERSSVGFDEGIDDFTSSGAVPLSLAPDPNEDTIEVFALWDSSALMLALASSDQTLCAQDRQSDGRDEILRDDAVEILLAPDELNAYRVTFNLAGSTSFERLDGLPWSPKEVYFRFDSNGPMPANDCQSGAGYTFKIRIPWNEVGFLVQPPKLEDLFAFDLVVYDNDRGARSVTAFSPMGPTEDLESLGELRLFEY